MKSIKLSGRALVLAEVIGKETREHYEDVNAIQVEAERLVGLRTASFSIRAKDMVNRIMEEVGIPPEMRSHFGLQTEYCDHHDAYIIALSREGENFMQGKIPDRVLH